MKNIFILKKCITFSVIIISVFLLFPTKIYGEATTLKAGIAKADITPTKAIYLGGYRLRTEPSDGVYGKLYTRALVFDDSRHKVVFIENDIIGYRDHKGTGDEDRKGIRQLISDETGIPFNNILFGCVHNHAAPRPGYEKNYPEWNKEFNSKVLSNIKEAINNLQPVRIGGGIGHSRIAINRRKKVEGGLSYETFDENYFSQSYGPDKTDNPVKILEIEGVVRLGANPEGPIDDEVGIMRIDDMSGNPIAVLVNYACHGTSLGSRNRTISPEWMGHMLEYVEENLPGVTGIYLQGAAGDINPRFVGGLEGYKDNLDKTKSLGYEIGQEVLSVFNTIKTVLPVSPAIKLVHKDIPLPKNYSKLPEDFRQTTVPVPTTIVRINDFTWATFPGELFHEIGKRIKWSTQSRFPFIVGYCNGSVGYLPTQKAFSEGGYEPAWSQFDPISEHVLVEEVKKMLIELF